LPGALCLLTDLWLEARQVLLENGLIPTTNYDSEIVGSAITFRERAGDPAPDEQPFADRPLVYDSIGQGDKRQQGRLTSRAKCYEGSLVSSVPVKFYSDGGQQLPGASLLSPLKATKTT
jgi:hypothetical protein